MNPRRIPRAEWKKFQATMPIVCVDVLPVRSSHSGSGPVDAVGLILRNVPRQGERWCLMGGRLLYCESLEEAVRRQIRETLGTTVQPIIPPGLQPIYVAEYSPTQKSPFAFDPRKHSVGLTYVVDLEGSPKARGEAKRFKWFKLGSLPSRKRFGFDQDRVVEACVTLLQLRNL